MSEINLRAPTAADWSAIHALAMAAVPWDTAGNREWLANRQQFAGLRRHYVAEMQSSGVIGYGAIEEGPEPGVFRMYVVGAAADLNGATGERLYKRLTADLVELAARGVWAREYASDDTIRAFFVQRGFTEDSRFTPPGYEEMVVLVKSLV